MNHVFQKLLIALLCLPFVAAGLLIVSRGASQDVSDALLCGAYFVAFGVMCFGYVWMRMARKG